MHRFSYVEGNKPESIRRIPYYHSVGSWRVFSMFCELFGSQALCALSNLNLSSIAFWFMPVIRKITGHKGAVRNLQITERNGNLLSSTTSSGLPLLSIQPRLPSLPLLSIHPIYHKPVPCLPIMSSTQFELLFLTYLMAAMIVQYINIYKTNVHVVDFHLALFISLILARRLAWFLVRQTLASEVVHSYIYWSKIAFKVSVVIMLLSVSCWSMYYIIQNSYIEDVLFLCYPFAVYLWTFGFTLNPYGHKVLFKLGHHQSPAVQDLIATNTSLFLQPQFNHSSTTIQPHNGKVSKTAQSKSVKETMDTMENKIKRAIADQNGHVNMTSPMCEADYCTLSPDSIRYEAECLRTDFNLKIKQVLFNSVISAYYVGFIPIKFTQNGWLYYDVWWSAQLILFVWINSFVLLVSQVMPYHYIDALHRCALHLGSWKRSDWTQNQIGHGETTHIWSPLTIWPQGIVVRHNKGLFEANGKQNAAVPGDAHHSRFHFMFHSPLRIVNWLVVLQVSSAVFQLYCLLRSHRWFQVVSLVVVLSFNYGILFRLLRERWAIQATLEEHEACAGT